MQQGLCLNLMHPTGLAGFHTTCGRVGELLLKPPQISQYSKNATNTNPKPPQNLRSAIIFCLISWWKIPQNGPKPLMWPEFILTLELVILNLWSVFFLEPQNPQNHRGKKIGSTSIFPPKSQAFCYHGLRPRPRVPQGLCALLRIEARRCLRRWSEARKEAVWEAQFLKGEIL